MKNLDSRDAFIGSEVFVEVDPSIISTEALLKTCYWFSRDYNCNIRKQSDECVVVSLSPKNPTPALDLTKARDTFLASAMDFALREKVEAKTSDIRDLLLAKAFSESGVLEDQPVGIFGDVIEEEKSDGMFKILNNPRH